MRAYAYKDCKEEKVIRLHTYEQWKKIHAKRQARKRAKAAKKLYAIIRKVSGFALVTCGLVLPFMWKIDVILSVLTFLSWIATACIVAVLILGLVGIGIYCIFK